MLASLKNLDASGLHLVVYLLDDLLLRVGLQHLDGSAQDHEGDGVHLLG